MVEMTWEKVCFKSRLRKEGVIDDESVAVETNNLTREMTVTMWKLQTRWWCSRQFDRF